MLVFRMVEASTVGDSSRAMQQPNQPIEEVFKEVRRNVGEETNGAQVPWESTSLTGFFTFRHGR